MAIKVRPLTQSDIPAAIDIIQRAFAEDPYFRWVFDEKSVCISFLTFSGEIQFLFTYSLSLYIYILNTWTYHTAERKRKQADKETSSTKSATTAPWKRGVSGGSTTPYST